MAFDPLNLLLLAIAVIVFWRLRSLLGTRTGQERPPAEPYSPRTGLEDGRTVTEVSGNRDKVQQNESPADSTEQPVWAGFADPGSAVATGLDRIAAADRGFSVRIFVEGAKVAYEMILGAFARGDKSELKNLLSREVLESFSQAIDQRERDGQQMESRFVGINEASIASASLTGKKASITVRFVSELISATLARDGSVVEGDPKEIRENTDIWTFERDITSRDPNWKLVSTEEPG